MITGAQLAHEAVKTPLSQGPPGRARLPTGRLSQRPQGGGAATDARQAATAPGDDTGTLMGGSSGSIRRADVSVVGDEQLG